MKELSVIQLPACCAPGAPPLSDEEAALLAERFRALSDPTRVSIVSRLAGGECCVCDLVEEGGLSQPTISHHLRILREAGLIEGEKRGTWSFYRLRHDAVAEVAHALTG